MPVGRRYTPYRKALAELKLKQLDVYRYKDHDVLRLLTPERKVVLVKLPRHREEMTLEEFKQYLVEALVGKK